MTTVHFRNVTKRYPNGFEAVKQLDLDVADGELLVVVGPSGCGKSTTLRMLAGLEDISEGEILIGDRVVNDIEARRRNIAMVFQSYALYPHLTVGGNLAYPLKVAKVDTATRERRVREVAELLRLTDLLDNKPRQLSGGQRQRVAMGRAMVREPEVFLMDEPLSNLDAKLRVMMRAEVSELQARLGATMFYVTHDQVEAMTMGDRVAVMDEGELQQVATPDDLYRHPANAFVAGFIGSPPMNRMRAGVAGTDGIGSARSGTVDIAAFSDGLTDRLLDAGARYGSTEFVVGIRPEHIGITTDGDGLPGVVRLVEHLGSEQIIHVDAAGVDLFNPETDHGEADTAPRILVNRRDVESRFRHGDRIQLSVSPEFVHIFDARTGAALTTGRTPTPA